MSSSAADRADTGGPEDWLRSKGLIQADEFILGIEIWAGEGPSFRTDSISIHFLLVKGTFDTVRQMMGSTRGTIPTNRVTTSIGVAEFIRLFKRFNVCLSPEGVLDGKKYEHTQA